MSVQVTQGNKIRQVTPLTSQLRVVVHAAVILEQQHRESTDSHNKKQKR